MQCNDYMSNFHVSIYQSIMTDKVDNQVSSNIFWPIERITRSLIMKAIIDEINNKTVKK
jgi:hypothetical protein